MLGDSHAMNIYNILAKAEVAPFVAGVARGGCRPHTPAAKCQYDEFDDWAQMARQTIKQVIYHQSGAYYLRDANGKVDSRKAFTEGAAFLVADDNIAGAIRYLERLAQIVPVTWLGPFVEARLRFEDLEYFTSGLLINETSLAHFSKLDQTLKERTGAGANFRYASLVDFLAIGRDSLRSGDCITYRDTDHFSACGEDLLARLNWRGLLFGEQATRR